MALKQILRSDGYYALNKKLLQCLGLEAAFYLTNLMDKYVYLLENKSLVWHEESKRYLMFSSIENIEQHTTLGRRPQEKAKKLLVDKGIIEVYNIGVPRKNHFWINEKAVWDLLKAPSDGGSSQCYQIGSTSATKMDSLVLPKRTHLQYQNGSTISNNTYQKQKKEHSSETIANFSDISSVVLFLDEGNTLPTAKLPDGMQQQLIDLGYGLTANGEICKIPF